MYMVTIKCLLLVANQSSVFQNSLWSTQLGVILGLNIMRQCIFTRGQKFLSLNWMPEMPLQYYMNINTYCNVIFQSSCCSTIPRRLRLCVSDSVCSKTSSLQRFFENHRQLIVYVFLFYAITAVVVFERVFSKYFF